MKTLKRIDFKFDLSYEVKEITQIKISYRGSINLQFASRKKDLIFSCAAYGTEINPALYSTIGTLNRDQYNYIQGLLSHEILSNMIKPYIQRNNFPPFISGNILIKSDEHYIFSVDEYKQEKGD